MLFLQIKTIVSAEHLLALKYEKISVHIWKQPSSLCWAKCTGFLPGLAAPRGEMAGKVPLGQLACPMTRPSRPCNDESRRLLRHTTPSRRGKEGPH